MAYNVTKNSLKALNVFYFIVSIIIIAVAGAAKGMAKVSSPAVAGGVIACGVFLLLVSVLGFVGAHKHHQVLLFIYMIVLALIFIIEFSVSIACLAVSTSQQNDLVKTAWQQLDAVSRVDLQNWGTCCGLEIATGYYYTHENSSSSYTGPAADSSVNPPVLCPCTDGTTSCGDALNATSAILATSTHTGNGPTCLSKLADSLDKGFKAAGGVGLFFSFTEIIGILAAWKFRNGLKQGGNNYN